MISFYIDPSLLWRYLTVVERAKSLSKPRNRDKQTIPLCNVLQWNRLGNMQVCDSSTTLPLIRITIDSCGIEKIDRVAVDEDPEYSPTSFRLFIVEYASKLSSVEAQFEVSIFIHTLHGLKDID